MGKLFRGTLAVLITAGALLAAPSSASADNADTPSFTLDKERVFLDEQSGTHIRVKLDTRPTAWVKVTVSTPDTSVFTLPGADDDSDPDDDTNLVLWFHRHNWNVYQQAYVWAVQDNDRIDELERVRFSAEGHDVATADVVVLETTSDTGVPTLTSVEASSNGWVTISWQPDSASSSVTHANVYRRNLSIGETDFTYVGSKEVSRGFVINTSTSTGINLFRLGETYPSTDSYSRTMAVYRNPPGGA